MLAGLLAAGPSATSINGIPVFCTEAGAGQVSARVRLIVAAGALHEDPGQEGVAHLLEHLILRRLNIDEHNGSTSWDFTDYVSDVRGTDLATAAVDLVRAVRTLEVTDQGFERERQVVVRELADRGMDQEVRDPIFSGTLFDRFVGGRSSGLARLSPADARAYHERHYRAGNMALVLLGATSCAALRARLEPELIAITAGSAAPRPIERRTEPGPRHIPDRRGLFLAGFYWYNEDPTSEMVLHVVARHLEQQALDELRARRGITYSPSAQVVRMGGAGMLRFLVTTDARTGEVRDWYDAALNALRSSETPTTLTRRAIEGVAKDLERDPSSEALAAIRGEPSPAEILRTLDDPKMRTTMARVLAPERAFGTTARSTGTIIAMIVFGIAVVGAFVLIGRQLLRG